MDDGDRTPLAYYDRHAADCAAPEPPGRRFFAWIDATGIFLPIWLVLLTLGLGTPLSCAVNGAGTCGRFAVGVAIYGGFSAAFVAIPYAVLYLVWRVAGVLVGLSATALVAIYGTALALVAIALRADANVAAVILGGCVVGVVACTAQLLASI